MKSTLKNTIALAVAATLLGAAGQVAAQVFLYENEGFQGRTFSLSRPINNLANTGFNDRASSVIVMRDQWEVCDNAGFGGRCVVLRPGRYESLAAMGLNDRVSSVRQVANNARIEHDRYAPPVAPLYDNRRRNNERVYEATVTSVRAVVGPPEQRCWITREQVVQQPGSNVPGAVVGALIGGILGHQIGNGRSNDLATVGGAIAGGAIGAQAGRNDPSVVSQNVQRCNTVPSQARPELWDVSYSFRGVEHRLQMNSPPGATVTVNRNGEPRA
jgi:uncharacterized protein YcfJ